MAVAIATEMRFRRLHPKKTIVENYSFDLFLICFQGVVNDKLKKIMFFYLKFGLESGNTFFKFFQIFFRFFAKFNSSKIVKKFYKPL